MALGITGISRPPVLNVDTIKGYLKKAIDLDRVVSDKALEALGIDESDLQAKENMRPKLVKVLSPHARIFPAPKDPNIFYIYNLKKVKNKEEVSRAIEKALDDDRLQECIRESIIPAPEAVFKIGSKRALLEVTFRKIAHYIGLGGLAIPGVFYMLQKPDLSKWSGDNKAEEELWNGNIKEFDFTGIRDKSCVIGILEPFLKKEHLSKKEEKKLFVFLVVLALATGLRDARSDNVLMQFLDIEEYMPNRLKPQENVEKACPATHLPFVLENPLKDESIEPDLLEEVRQVVFGWDPETLTKKLEKLEVVFADYLSESIVVNEQDESSDEDFIEDHKIEDQGGCEVTVYSPLDMMFVDEHLFSKKDVKKEPFIFNEKQLATFKERLTKLQQILRNDYLTPYNIIELLDGFYTQDVKLRLLVEELRGSSLAEDKDGSFTLERAHSNEGVSPKTLMMPVPFGIACASGRFSQFIGILHATDQELFELGRQMSHEEEQQRKERRRTTSTSSVNSSDD